MIFDDMDISSISARVFFHSDTRLGQLFSTRVWGNTFTMYVRHFLQNLKITYENVYELRRV